MHSFMLQYYSILLIHVRRRAEIREKRIIRYEYWYFVKEVIATDSTVSVLVQVANINL